jgi:transketolase
VYLRLVSVPWELGFDPPACLALSSGRGTVLREGEDIILVATGPVLISQAWEVAARFETRGVSVGVVALPWLRDIDGRWLAEVAQSATVVTIDNHYLAGGQGDAILAAFAREAPEVAARLVQVGVTEVPRCGRNDEVLRAHRLDAEGLEEQVLDSLGIGSAAV